MAKRFTATDKWDDPWFCGLSDQEKLFWFYLLDKCDHAGIWQVNWPLVKFYIKGPISETVFKNRIVVVSEDKWHIPKFVSFQYGELNPLNKAHASVISILAKNGINKDLASPLQAPKDKDMDMDKAMDKKKDSPPTKLSEEELDKAIAGPLYSKPIAHSGPKTNPADKALADIAKVERIEAFHDKHTAGGKCAFCGNPTPGPKPFCNCKAYQTALEGIK